VYVEANHAALDEVYGTAAEGTDLPGDTAPAHTRRALRAAGFDDAQIDEGLARWCETFSARYVELLAEADTSHWELGPYAHEAVAAVERPALLSGNPSAIAHARMDRLGFGRFFPQVKGPSAASARTGSRSSPWRANARQAGRPSGRSPSATRRSTSRRHMRQAACALE
jgi:hypothetical protein